MASRTAVSASDPELNDVILESRDPDHYRTQIARDLASLGRPKKARRLDDCERFGHMQKCEDNHLTECVSLCYERGCEKCAERRFDNYMEEYWLTADHLAKGAGKWAPPKFTFIDIRIPCEYSNDAIKEHVARVTKVMDRSRQHPQAWKKYSRAIYIAGFDPEHKLVIRVLAFDNAPWTPELIAGELAGYEVEVNIVHTVKVEKECWFAFLFEVTLPGDSLSRAKMEVAFEHLRTLRAVGFKNLHDDPEMIVEEESTTTNNADDPDNLLNSDEDRSKPHCCKVCPRCGKPIVSITRTYNRYNRSSDPAVLGWHAPPD